MLLPRKSGVLWENLGDKIPVRFQAESDFFQPQKIPASAPKMLPPVLAHNS